MEWTRRNILTLSTILLAFAAFASELAGALPPGEGATIAKWSIIAIAAARGLVNAAEQLSRRDGDQS